MNGNHFDIHDLKREYEKGRKQGAVEELEKLIKWYDSEIDMRLSSKEYAQKRLGELK